VSIPTANLPIYARVIQQAYCSLFGLTGGWRYYVLDASDNNVRIYLPAVVAGTRLVFVRADAGASGHTARVYAKTDAPINGSTTAYLDLILAGDAAEVVPGVGALTWIIPSRTVSLTW